MNIVEKAVNAVFGTKHDRDVKRMRPLVAAINEREPEIKELSDEELKERIAHVRDRVRKATEDLPEDPVERRRHVQEVLDAELVEVFAIVRETAWRTLHMRHFDVQLMGGIVLHEGKIS